MKETCLIFILSVLFLKVASQTSIPCGVSHQTQQIFLTHPLSTNLCIQGWMQATTIKADSIANNGYVKIDSLKLIEMKVNGDSVVKTRKDYNGTGSLTYNEGGLYHRFNKWYEGGTHTIMTNSHQEKGTLRVDAGLEPTKISHWWTERISDGNISSTYFLEVSMMISGNIGVQLGCDYWTNMADSLENDTLGWCSDWYGDTGGKYITIMIPATTLLPMFDYRDYGITTSGYYYAAKRMIDFFGVDEVSVLYEEASTLCWSVHPMNLEGDYYVYNTNAEVTKYQTYCFRISRCDSGLYLPHIILSHLVSSNDTESNKVNGYNFKTLPQSSLGGTTFAYKPSSENVFYAYINANNKLVIKINEVFTEKYKLTVYNIQGQELIKQPIINNKTQVDIDTLLSGTYLIRLTNNKKTETKVIKIIR